MDDNIMDDTWYKIPWRVFCIGKLGTEFYNRYKDKIPEEFEAYNYDFESYSKEHWSFCVLDDPEKILPYCDLKLYSKEHWMLIAEYDQKIWDKYLENAEIKKLLQLITLKFIIIHPVNNALSPIERQFVQLMWNEPPAIFDPDFPHTLLLAMPNSILQSSLEYKCRAIYDLINTMYLQWIGGDYHDMVRPGEHNNHYGLVYEANCASLMQMVQIATEITEKIIQDIPIEDITYVHGMIFGTHATFKSTGSAVAVWEDTFDKKTDFVWSGIIGTSEYGATVVVYRKLLEG